VKRGGHHTAETKARMRARNIAFWTPEERAKQAERTRRRMANPTVRERIRAGMMASTPECPVGTILTGDFA
jgi:hypothetical protein